MLYKLLIAPAAFIDTEDAYDYYEKQQQGLGERFLKFVDDSYTKLSNTPHHYGFVNNKKDLRDLRIKNFPFVIIFQIFQDKVLVLRVFNTNRNPLSIRPYIL